ncbi:MAG: hypothetical protein ACR2KM_04135 [Gemmatimonadaceae bacterium]
MTTTQEQVREALEATGEAEGDLVCFYRPPYYIAPVHITPKPTLVRCSVAELPTREYDAGYGGVEGEEVICFGPRYVYFRATYDGAEWITSAPRNPEVLTEATDLIAIGGG